MGSNNFDGPLLIDSASHYLGFVRAAGAAVSTGPRLRGGHANLAALASLADPAGSLAMLSDGTLAIRGSSAWAALGTSFTAIADPGNGGAIPVTTNGYCPIVTAGAETRTLAAPTFAGQQLSLYMKTDGGNCVITAAAAINAAGNNTITFADVTDHLKLEAVESGANLVWRVVSSDGAALSTV